MSDAFEFAGPATRLGPDDITAEAGDLGVSTAVIRAVCDVEAAGAGFLPDGRPKILYEAHIFSRVTGGVWDATHPSLSSPRWNRVLYGAGGAHQYDRLAAALTIDREAAMRACSWGMFQILGDNYEAAGYVGVTEFVAAMVAGERAHLDAFTKFCLANHLDDELRAEPPRFADFARGYNGPGYAANAYDIKLAAAWRKWTAEPHSHPDPQPRTAISRWGKTLQYGSSGSRVRALQERLVGLGYRIDIDGDFGPQTLAAVVLFQKEVGLIEDGIVGTNTRAALLNEGSRT